MSMRSKPVTQSNGVVVRKSSIRKLPIKIKICVICDVVFFIINRLFVLARTPLSLLLESLRVRFLVQIMTFVIQT